MLSLENAVALPFPALGGAGGGFDFTQWEASAQLLTSRPQPLSVPARTGGAAVIPQKPTQDDARRIRRMLSNRESARRSRMRKQRRLEDLRSRADQLRSENREVGNRLGVVTRHCLLFRRDNRRLRLEAAQLRRRLADMQTELIVRLVSSSAWRDNVPA